MVIVMILVFGVIAALVMAMAVIVGPIRFISVSPLPG
jgi:hypothetical protein